MKFILITIGDSNIDVSKFNTKADLIEVLDIITNDKEVAINNLNSIKNEYLSELQKLRKKYRPKIMEAANRVKNNT